MSWNSTFKNFGKVEEGETLSFTFKYSGKKVYEKHSTSCGCTTGNWINNSLQVNFKPKNVPVKILDTGVNHYTSTKYITIYWTDKTSDKLTVTAEVYEKP